MTIFGEEERIGEEAVVVGLNTERNNAVLVLN
jgi:hypothetical protein